MQNPLQSGLAAAALLQEPTLPPAAGRFKKTAAGQEKKGEANRQMVGSIWRKEQGTATKSERFVEVHHVVDLGGVFSP